MVARITVPPEAERQLRRLVSTRSLPASAPRRLELRLRRVAEFPLLGRPLDGRWAGHRFVHGPWPWMLIVYRCDEAADTVLVPSIQDAREAQSARGNEDR